MTKFKVGSTYQMRSACDHNCTWTYEVVKRTVKTITLDNGNTHRISVSCDGSDWWNNDVESVKPLGTYSMSPTLRASKEVHNEL